jgi:tight adherence protein C
MVIFALALFAGAVVLAVRWYVQRTKQEQKQPQSEGGGAPGLWRSAQPLVRQLAGYSRHVPLLGLRERYANQIERAGLRFELSADEFLGIKVASLLFGAGVAFLVYIAVYQNMMVVAAIVFLGLVFPDIRLSAAVQKQEHAFLRALPGFLDLLALSVEAGMGFDSAVLRLTEVLEPGPLTWRFQTMLRSMNVGKTRTEALREMSQKLNMAEFTSFANVVIQATDTGASMGPVLRTASGEMLARRFERAEQMAHELPVKILLPLFVFVFPATFIMVLGPVYFQFMASGAGGLL